MPPRKARAALSSCATSLLPACARSAARKRRSTRRHIAAAPPSSGKRGSERAPAARAAPRASAPSGSPRRALAAGSVRGCSKARKAESSLALSCLVSAVSGPSFSWSRPRGSPPKSTTESTSTTESEKVSFWMTDEMSRGGERGVGARHARRPTATRRRKHPRTCGRPMGTRAPAHRNPPARASSGHAAGQRPSAAARVLILHDTNFPPHISRPATPPRSVGRVPRLAGTPEPAAQPLAPCASPSGGAACACRGSGRAHAVRG